MARRAALPFLLLALASPAYAGGHDLALLNLCPQHTAAPGTLNAMVPECSWVQRQPGGLIDAVALDADAESRFRSLMSELGVVMAPRLMVPAETLGYAGFQVAGEVGLTSISSGEPFWNGVQGVSPANPRSTRPDDLATTVGVYLRKGLWIPLPAFEAGLGVMHLLDSQMLSWQGYLKLALHEGFQDWPLPALAVRGSAAYVTGTDQVRMMITGADVILSKGYGLLKTSRLELFGGWSFLFIKAKSGLLDATPSCDAAFVHLAGPGQVLGDYCADSQRGTRNDLVANFVFPSQSAITRHRFFGGAKLKFAAMFLAAQYEYVPAGRSHDDNRANGARDGSNRQQGFSLGAGFDF
jgi:hypothetical protein